MAGDDKKQDAKEKLNPGDFVRKIRAEREAEQGFTGVRRWRSTD
jgi:hypothetical protein